MSGWLWLVAAGAAGLWWAVNRESKGSAHGGKHGRKGGEHGGKAGGATAKRLFNFALWCIAIIALLHAPLFGTYIAEIGAGVLRWFVNLLGVGVPAAAVAEIALWVLLIAAVIDLKGRRVDHIARTFIVAAPVLAIISTGPVGDGVEKALHTLNGGSVQVVQDLAQ